MEMSEECRNAIYSNDYADFIVKLDGNYTKIEQEFDTDCIHPIDGRYAVVHVAVDRLPSDSIQRFGYASFPIYYGLLDTSALEQSGILRLQNLPALNLRGQGLLIGMVDTGIDYTNPVFLRGDGTTKILSIWDQTIQSDNFPANTFYGTEYVEEQINQALRSEDPFSIVPSTDENGHGTFLAGIIAGNRDDASDFVGVVPDANLVVVKLKTAKQNVRDIYFIPNDVLSYQNNDIMFGVKYLLDVAANLNRPIAICIALGTNQTSHDGRDSLSDFLSYHGQTNGVAIVIAVGNEGNQRHHYFGEINEVKGFDTVEINVGPDEPGIFMELWGFAPNTYSIDIMSPSGEYIPRIPARLNERRVIRFLFEATVITVNYTIVESDTGDPLILIRMQSPTVGIWRINVYGSGDTALTYHIWLPMKNFIGEETFFVRSNPDTTLTSPGGATIPITVAAYDHVTQSLYIDSGRGYTRIGMVKPDITAPGVNVYGPQLGGTFGTDTGTSIAAAITTGVAAIMLEWGIVRGNQTIIDTIEIKSYLKRGASRDPTQTYPNQRWGYGVLDLFNIFSGLRRDL